MQAGVAGWREVVEAKPLLSRQYFTLLPPSPLFPVSLSHWGLCCHLPPRLSTCLTQYHDHRRAPPDYLQIGLFYFDIVQFIALSPLLFDKGNRALQRWRGEVFNPPYFSFSLQTCEREREREKKNWVQLHTLALKNESLSLFVCFFFPAPFL